MCTSTNVRMCMSACLPLNFKQVSFLWNFYFSEEILKLAEYLSHRCN